MNSRVRSLIADFLFKLQNNLGFTALFALVFERTHRSFELGIVSIAIILPSLGFTFVSNRLFRRFVPLQVFRFSLIVRTLIFFLGACFAQEVHHIALLAGIASLLHQMAGSAKLTYDSALIEAGGKTSFNSKRAFLGNISTIVGFSLGGALVAFMGGALTLSLIGALSCLAALLPANVKSVALSESSKAAASGPAPSTLRYLLGAREILVLVTTYVIVVAILEMEAPIVFPFVREAFQRGEQAAGYLLGACGIGGLLGALLFHARQKPLPASWITLLIAFDGACLYLATLGVSFWACLVLFCGLGVIGTATLISVETTVQEEVPLEIQPALFSILQFAGGVGGAALTLVSTALADRYGAAHVLRYSALLEGLMGVVGIGLIVMSVGVVREKSAS